MIGSEGNKNRQVVLITICLSCSVFCCYLGSYLSSKEKSRFYIYDFDAPKNGLWAAKKPDKIGLFAGYIFFVPFRWQRAVILIETLKGGATSVQRGAVLHLRGCIVFDNSTVTPHQTGGYRSNIRIPAQSDTCINESPGKSFLSSSATK